MPPQDGLQAALLAWFDAEKRPLPWRDQVSAYRTWVSEIMLQQTQVATVIPYFHAWMERFSDVASLAEADENEVLKYWQGLGYYRRARSLRAGAQFVVEHGMPSNAEGWRSVPGVGRYTAGAIASIAQGEVTPLVDGNVERVYARLVADGTSPPALSRNAWIWAEKMVDRDRPGSWNEALMELGATVCRPRFPLCHQCPVQAHCAAHQDGLTGELPVAAPRKAFVSVTHTLYLAEHDGSFATRVIPEGEWWSGMTSFPLVVGDAPERPFAESKAQLLGTIRHTVTHHRIELRVMHVRAGDLDAGYQWLTRAEIDAAPLPAPHRKAWKLLASS